MAPASGASAPAIKLKRVVFPAPFGPMSPVMVPGSIVRSTLSTARRLPNDLTSADTSSMTPDYGKARPPHHRPDVIRAHQRDAEPGVLQSSGSRAAGNARDA